MPGAGPRRHPVLAPGRQLSHGQVPPRPGVTTGRRAEGIKRRYLNERGFALLDEVDKVATAHHATPAQVALAWLLARPSITAPIIGANSVEQLRETLAAGEIQLDPEAIMAHDAAGDWRAW